jgi:hypothetical protein
MESTVPTLVVTGWHPASQLAFATVNSILQRQIRKARSPSAIDMYHVTFGALTIACSTSVVP